MNELTGADFKSATEMKDDNKKLFIETYGCQMNVADSEVIASVMQMAGYSVAETLEEADAVFMNTCSIRDNAEQKILNRLEFFHSLKKKKKHLIVGVLGCMAERVKDDLITNHHVDLVVGPDAYLTLPYIRGIGTVSGTPPVGLYVDGVPVFDKNAFVFDLYDIRQIEVLRGPQTTLYGRNSINGLININTNPPSDVFAAQVKIGYSSYRSQNYNLVLNLPWKRLYNKLSFSYNKSEGYFKNHYEQDRKSNPSDSYNIRYQGNVFTKNNWKIGFGINFNHSFDGGYAYAAIDSLKVHRYTVNYNIPSSYKRDLLSSYLNLKKKWQRLAFNTVTSYSRTQDRQMLDADFTYLDVFDNGKKSRQNLLTQEFNIQSNENRHVDWTAGAFGFYKDLTNRYLATFGEDKAYLLPMALDNAIYLCLCHSQHGFRYRLQLSSSFSC